MTFIVSAIVSLLVYFFERWWTAHHPISPAIAKTAFLVEVQRPHRFWMGSRRKEYAEKLFDKFAARYQADPPLVNLSSAPLTAEEAKAITAKYTAGLTLTDDETK